MQDKIDFSELFIVRIVLKWKVIFLTVIAFSLIGGIASSFFSSSYFTEARITNPTNGAFLNPRVANVLELDREEAFLRMFDELRSMVNFYSFLEQELFVDEDFIAAYNLPKTFRFYESRFGLNFLENEVPREEDEELLKSMPLILKLTFESGYEELNVKILNGYIEYVNKLLHKEYAAEFFKKKSDLLESFDIQREIELDKYNYSLKAEVAKMVDEIEVEIEKLEEKKAQLIKSILDSNDFQLKVLESENQLKLSNLTQSKKLEIQNLELSRQRRLRDLSDALEVSKKLKINFPSFPQHVESNTGVEKAEQTYNYFSQSTIPLEFMGTEYLKAKMEVLSNREVNSLNYPSLAAIEAEIYRVENDIHIEHLKDSKHTLLETPEVLEIEGQIKALENDIELKDLKSKINNENYISSNLVALVEKINGLNKTEFPIGEVSYYKTIIKAYISNSPKKVNPVFVVIVFGLIGLLLALSSILVMVAQESVFKYKVKE